MVVMHTDTNLIVPYTVDEHCCVHFGLNNLVLILYRLH